MAEPIIEQGEQFRKSKRALLTIAAGAILFGVAKVGATFAPQVLGHDVEIRSWIISFGLLIYTSYLWIGFEHEQRRAMAVYNEQTYADDPIQRTPEAAVERLAEPINQFGQKFQMLAEELALVERTYRQLAPDFVPTTDGLSSWSFASLHINDAMNQVRSIVPEEGYGAKEHLQAKLNDTLMALERVPGLVLEDVRKLLAPGIEASNQRKLQADDALERLQSIRDRMDTVSNELRIAHADVNRLSKRLSSRERYMFSYHDTWAPRLLAAVAVLLSAGHLVRTVVDHWPLALACRLV